MNANKEVTTITCQIGEFFELIVANNQCLDIRYITNCN